MKNKLYLFLLISTLLLITACGDQVEDKTPILKYEELKPEPKIVKKKAPPAPKEYDFLLINLNNQTVRIHVKNNRYSFLEVQQPIVLMSLFATWCPPCVGQIPHLNKLQKKYNNQLFVLGTLIHDSLDDNDLDKFIASQKINFFVSKDQKKNRDFTDFISPKLQLGSNFPLPVMILFVNGKYYTHYEGSIPEEMIESDIKQALKKIQG